MKKLILILTLFVAGFAGAKAQDNDGPNPKRQERIKALYVAYITQKLSLTSDEAQKFWPVYNQYDNDIQGVKKDMPELEKQQTILNIKKRYQDNFTRILGSADRCEKFYKLDGDFKQKLLEMIKNRQENKPGRFRGGGGNNF